MAWRVEFQRSKISCRRTRMEKLLYCRNNKDMRVDSFSVKNQAMLQFILYNKHLVYWCFDWAVIANVWKGPCTEKC